MTLLSVVTGTYNRLPYLQLMVQSVRAQLPRGFPYNFTVVDGGSTDGTLDWCKAQPDILLIEDGALLGAISAFSRGAEASDAEYLLFANDDVMLHPYSILRAVAYLETHAHCAAVAFRDNRTSTLTGSGRDYRTEGIGVTLPDGTASMKTYMQVGVVRKALAKAAGYWGYEDRLMQHARVYGGDSYLSARLWEMGYTVDDVEGCACDDLIVRDALREHNTEVSTHDSSLYYQRFPTVQLPAQLQTYPIPERLRFLHLPIYEAGHKQTANVEAGLTEAFSDYGICLDVDYLNAPDLDLPRLAQAWQPDLILTQIQGWGERMTPQMLADMRKAAPSAVVVNWNGDAHERGLVDSRVYDLLRHVDLQTTVNAKVLPTYQADGIPAAYWQIYYKHPVGTLPDMPHHDVLLQMNWYEYRRDLFDVVYNLRRHGYDVGVYGNDQRANGNTHYSFAQQAALYANATLSIGDTFPNTEGFVSNRVFQTLGAGGFMLQQHSLNLEHWTGLVDGVHYVGWSDLSDLVAKVAEWTAPEKAAERKRIAECGQAFVREHFSAQAQVRKLLTELLPKLELEKA